jgi:hypothetical protein
MSLLSLQNRALMYPANKERWDFLWESEQT